MYIRTGIIALVCIVGGYTLFKSSTELGSGKQTVRARLTDAKGTPLGAPVTMAGLHVGQVVERRVGSNYAEIRMEFSSQVVLREDATLIKRRISLLSGPSLEIDPGNSEKPLVGNYILRVREADPLVVTAEQVAAGCRCGNGADIVRKWVQTGASPPPIAASLGDQCATVPSAK